MFSPLSGTSDIRATIRIYTMNIILVPFGSLLLFFFKPAFIFNNKDIKPGY